ncbi:BrnA antitoxin family protein [Xanthobacter autotrophicus]|uniref:BrnA antitoxin family protein n=1 Tax=Xanthobacter autotrophicus TaxID=280 RepID=UPI00372A07AD
MTKRKAKEFEPGKGYTKADWDAVSDTPEITPADMKKAKPFAEAFPVLAEKARQVRGAQKAPTKVPVSIRLSPEVVEHFKAGGPGWQARIDDALRKMVSGA